MEKPAKQFVWAASLLLCLEGQGGLVLRCADALHSLLSGEKSQWSDESVKILYFPASQHMKLSVGEDVYGNECPGNRCAHTTLDRVDRVSTLGGGPQIRFEIRVTNKDLARVRKYIEDGRFGDGLNCAHSACRTLHKNTGVVIPLPVSVSPLFTALYLNAARAIPGSRIEQVTLHPGKSEKGEYTSTALEFLVGVLVVPVGGIILSNIPSGDDLKLLISVEQPQDLHSGGVLNVQPAEDFEEE